MRSGLLLMALGFLYPCYRSEYICTAADARIAVGDELVSAPRMPPSKTVHGTSLTGAGLVKRVN